MGLGEVSEGEDNRVFKRGVVLGQGLISLFPVHAVMYSEKFVAYRAEGDEEVQLLPGNVREEKSFRKKSGYKRGRSKRGFHCPVSHQGGLSSALRQY